MRKALRGCRLDREKLGLWEIWTRGVDIDFSSTDDTVQVETTATSGEEDKGEREHDKVIGVGKLLGPIILLNQPQDQAQDQYQDQYRYQDRQSDTEEIDSSFRDQVNEPQSDQSNLSPPFPRPFSLSHLCPDHLSPSLVNPTSFPAQELYPLLKLHVCSLLLLLRKRSRGMN